MDSNLISYSDFQPCSTPTCPALPKVIASGLNNSYCSFLFGLSKQSQFFQMDVSLSPLKVKRHIGLIWATGVAQQYFCFRHLGFLLHNLYLRLLFRILLMNRNHSRWHLGAQEAYAQREREESVLLLHFRLELSSCLASRRKYFSERFLSGHRFEVIHPLSASFSKMLST